MKQVFSLPLLKYMHVMLIVVQSLPTLARLITCLLRLCGHTHNIYAFILRFGP